MQGARSEAQSQKSQVANACFQKAGGAGNAGARGGRGGARGAGAGAMATTHLALVLCLL